MAWPFCTSARSRPCSTTSRGGWSAITCGYRPERVPLSRRVVPIPPLSILVAPNALRPYAEGVWGDESGVMPMSQVVPSPTVTDNYGLVGRRAAVWHGDVPASIKKRLLAEPPDCLLTTPESLE